MKLSSRQLFFFLAAVAPVGKLVLMPSQLAALSKNDLLFPAALNLLLQAGAVFCALLFARRGQTLYACLRERCGTVFAKIAVCVFALFLWLAAFVPLLEQKLLVQNIFYDTLPSYIAFAPMFVFSAYLCAKPLEGCGRTWDILAPMAAIGLLGILLLAVGKADYGALLPVGAAGAGGFARGALGVADRFFDGALVLAMAGRFEYRRGMAWKGLLCYLAGGAAVLFFLATFYGLFGEIAVFQVFGFTRISKYFSGVTVLGRIDFLFIFALAFAMVFYTVLPLQAGVTLAREALAPRNPLFAPALACAVNAAALIGVLAVNFMMTRVMQVFSGPLVWVFPVFSLAVPALSLLPRRRRHAP